MKLHTISINNLKHRKAMTIGLMVGIAIIVTLVTLTMSSDIERKMDEFGANILVTPKSKASP